MQEETNLCSSCFDLQPYILVQSFQSMSEKKVGLVDGRSNLDAWSLSLSKQTAAAAFTQTIPKLRFKWLQLTVSELCETWRKTWESSPGPEPWKLTELAVETGRETQQNDIVLQEPSVLSSYQSASALRK